MCTQCMLKKREIEIQMLLLTVDYFVSILHLFEVPLDIRDIWNIILIFYQIN